MKASAVQQEIIQMAKPKLKWSKERGKWATVAVGTEDDLSVEYDSYATKEGWYYSVLAEKETLYGMTAYSTKEKAQVAAEKRYKVLLLRKLRKLQKVIAKFEE